MLFILACNQEKNSRGYPWAVTVYQDSHTSSHCIMHIRSSSCIYKTVNYGYCFQALLFSQTWKQAHDGCKELALLTDYEQSVYGLCSFITHYKWTELMDSIRYGLIFFFTQRTGRFPLVWEGTNGINLCLGTCNDTLNPCHNHSAGSDGRGSSTES